MRVPRSIATVAAVAAFAMAGQAAAGQVLVRRGDTLSGLAARAGVSVGELARANDIADVHRIRAGQVLRLPGRAAAASPAGSAGKHLIARGETLAAIAGRHGLSVSALADANGIRNRHRIIAGTYLTIPGGGTAPAPTAPAAATATTTHTVRSGETLSAVAKRYGVTIAALVEANGIANPHRVREGTKLTVPAGGAAPTGAATDGGTRLPPKLAADPARLALIPVFDRWAAEYGIPADLLKAMAWMESGWQNGVRSSVGAMGIGQLMPDTVDFVSDRLLKERLDPWVPEQNIRMSARYLRWLLDQAGGSTTQALAGYYQGPRSVRERGMFNQTRAYVEGIQALRARFS